MNEDFDDLMKPYSVSDDLLGYGQSLMLILFSVMSCALVYYVHNTLSVLMVIIFAILNLLYLACHVGSMNCRKEYDRKYRAKPFGT